MIDYKRLNMKVLKKYYETEIVEQERLYDFSKPYSLYYDLSRVDAVIQLSNDVDYKAICLDVGCGSGYYIRKISTKSNLYVGIDISPQKLKWAKEKIESNIELVIADVTYLPFKSCKFNFVLCSEVIEHLVNPIRLLKEISRVCKHHALITTPTKTTLWRLFLKKLGRETKYGLTHIKEFQQEELIEEVKKTDLKIRKIIGTPFIEFPGINLLLKRRILSLSLYLLNKKMIAMNIFKRFGVFTCLLCEKK